MCIYYPFIVYVYVQYICKRVYIQFYFLLMSVVGHSWKKIRSESEFDVNVESELRTYNEWEELNNISN